MAGARSHIPPPLLLPILLLSCTFAFSTHSRASLFNLTLLLVTPFPHPSLHPRAPIPIPYPISHVPPSFSCLLFFSPLHPCPLVPFLFIPPLPFPSITPSLHYHSLHPLTPDPCSLSLVPFPCLPPSVPFSLPPAYLLSR